MAAPITVIKIGGSTLGNHDTSLDDIAALHAGGRRFVLVHGGGATISEWLERHGIESRFVRGLRVTDAATLDVVVAVLAGLVNKRLVAELLSRGARAIGLSGVDAAVLRARRYDPGASASATPSVSRLPKIGPSDFCRTMPSRSMKKVDGRPRTP